MPTGCPFLGSASRLHPQFSGPHSQLRYNLGGLAVSVLQPSIPSSHGPMHIPAGGVLIPLGLTPWHWARPGKKGKSFPGLLLLQCTALALLPAPHSSISGSWKGWSSLSCGSQKPRYHHSRCSHHHYPVCLPLNLGSCLLFPAQASGYLLLGSAHPLGSTVRLRDPAQEADRQGSEPQSCHGERAAKREGMKRSLCRLPAHCCQQPQTFLSLSLSLPPEPLHSPCLPTLTLLPGHSGLSWHSTVPMPPLSPTHRQEKAQSSCHCLALIFSSSLLFLNLVRVGEKEVGTSEREPSRHHWLAHHPRVRKAGPYASNR